MAIIESKELQARFSLPDRLTVRQRMEYSAAVLYNQDKNGIMVALWEAAKLLITDWQCDVPLDVDLDSIADPRTADVLMWAGMQTYLHVRGLTEPDPNASGPQ